MPLVYRTETAGAGEWNNAPYNRAANVQTEQGRKSSVYAVKIQVDNPDQKLKPGMPADADFNLH